MNKIIRLSFKLLAFLLLGLVLVNGWIIFSTSPQVFSTIEALPSKDVGLVLGTSHRLSSGDSNRFFHQRIDLAADLFNAGKIKHIIVSGDNSTPYYNEPRNMKNALINKGIPSYAIDMDFAGFRTLDSMIRCKEVFGQDDIVVITQTFHSYRALFIGNKHDMTAVALSTENLPLDVRISVEIRELFARTVAVWDLFIVNKMPKYLGKEEDIQIQK